MRLLALPLYLCLCAAFTCSATATVSVVSPTSGATLGSPVHFSATASTNTCSRGVASMGIYINNKLVYVVNGTVLNTSLALSAGAYKTVVEEWDYCGGATYAVMPVTVVNQTGVWVASPANGATTNSPVSYSANASTSTCSKGVASMGVYVDNHLMYVQNGTSLNANLQVSPGGHNTVVEEWDYCGGASYKSMNITVNGSGNSLYNLQAGSWISYGEYPPAYNVCTSCGGGVTWWVGPGVKSPSLSGNATQFNLGGTTPYSDVLHVNRVIGQGGKVPDVNHQILPNSHYFTYDAYFYGSNLSLSQVLEFDISMYFNGMSFIFGNQCRLAGGNAWDVWDNVNARWSPANVPCHPVNNSWNHVTIQVQRTSNNQLLFHSITLNGNTAVIDRYSSPTGAPSGWYGATVNFQTDGNYHQSPYTVFLDNLTFSYW